MSKTLQEGKFYADSIAPSQRGKCIPLSGREKRVYVEDAKVFDANFAFLSTTLAKLHTKVYEPKSHFTYAEDIPVDTGGGFVDYVEYMTVDWAGILADTRNVFGNNGNLVPRINASMTQNRVPVYTYEIAYDLRFVELEKMKKVTLQKSIDKIYEEGILVGFDYFTQNVAYTGINGSKGLFNSANVLVGTIDNSATTGHGFEGLADAQVVGFINGLLTRYLIESNMNTDLLPDTILVPSFVSEDLCNRMSALYTNTLLDFVKEHNIGKAQAGEKFKLEIKARPQLDDLGTAGAGRIVAYRKEKEYVRLDMPYPIQHFITLPNADKLAYTTAFVGQVSVIQLPYNESSAKLGAVTYWDFTTVAD
jgi:hypothetical protein